MPFRSIIFKGFNMKIHIIFRTLKRNIIYQHEFNKDSINCKKNLNKSLFFLQQPRAEILQALGHLFAINFSGKFNFCKFSFRDMINYISDSVPGPYNTLIYEGSAYFELSRNLFWPKPRIFRVIRPQLSV